MKNRKRKIVRKLKKVFCVIVDNGQTERWYFSLMAQHEKNLPVKIKPDLPSKSGIKNRAEYILERCKEGYDKVFWLVDMDSIVGQNQSGEFNKVKKSLQNWVKNGKLEILINNPCFEFWFLLHFTYTTGTFHSCKAVIERLKKCKPMSSYKKEGSYYFGNPDIYERLKSYQRSAVKNARMLDKYNREVRNNPPSPSAQIYRILEACELG